MISTVQRLGYVPDLVHAALIAVLACVSSAFLFRATPRAAVSTRCASVSCETIVVYDAQNGGFQVPPPCLNQGCAAGCSHGGSSVGGGWLTCKCGGQVEPRCCHVIYKPDGLGGYDVSTAGTCSQSQGCPGGTTCFPLVEGIEGEFFEITAACSI